MTDKTQDGGPEKVKMVRSPGATPEEPTDVEGHKNYVKDAGPESAGTKHMTTFDATDDDVEGHKNYVKDAGPESAGTKHMTTFDATDDDVEGHGRRVVS